ncbi:MAG: prepilin peptidase [Coprococcus sp.]
MILQMTLLLFMAAAAVKDYRSYWVPNELILAGALNGYILRFWADGSGGVIDGAAGMVLIFILCAGFFVLSMFGAGDLKLMMAMAVYMGPVKSVRILIVSLVFGAVISLLKMLKYDICRERFRYLLHLRSAYKGMGQNLIWICRIYREESTLSYRLLCRFFWHWQQRLLFGI